MCDNECISKGKCGHNEECYDDVKYEFGCEVTKIEECPLNREIRADERKKINDELSEVQQILILYDVDTAEKRREIIDLLEQIKEHE